MLTEVLPLNQASTKSVKKDEAADSLPPSFQSIRTGLDGAAFQAARSIEQAARAIINGAFSLGRSLLSMKKELNYSEYQIFLAQPGWTPAKANKYIKLVKTFESFSIEQIGRISLDTLFTLCGSRYQELVVRLQEMGEFSQELVERLMKESRLPRQRTQPQPPITGWKHNPSGGGRYYQVLLHDEETGVKIEEMAEQQQVLPQRVIANAIAAWYELQVPADQTAAARPSAFSSWEEMAAFVKRDRSQLLNLAASWSHEERTLAVELLSAHLEVCPTALKVELQWVPKHLLNKALSPLSFTLQRIGGPNNLFDEPKIEYVRGCRFVSLEYPGTRNEQWIFADRDNKLYPVFDMDEFEIES